MRVSAWLDLVGLKKGWIPDQFYFQRGTDVHSAAEMDDLGFPSAAEEQEYIRPYLDGWRKFKAEMKPEILPGKGISDLAIEEHLESATYDLTGTCDRRVVLRGHRVLEIKCGEPAPWHRWQVALYRLLWSLQNAGQATPLGVAVYLDGKGNFKIPKEAWFDDRRDVERAKSIIDFGNIFQGK